jgi:excisionase family DNA binding protein
MPSPGQNKPHFLTVNEVALALNVCPKTVRRLIATRVLHHHRVGRAVRVSEDDLRGYVNSTRQ